MASEIIYKLKGITNMKKTTHRNYVTLVNEIINMSIPFSIEIIDIIKYDYFYPLLKISNSNKTGKYTAVIQAGIHGNEPEGIFVLLKWLQNVPNSVLNQINFIIFPIMNPYGYAHRTRRNGKKQMVNSLYFWTKNEQIPELINFNKHYPKNLNLFIDIHGDCGKYGKENIYAYERIPKEAKSPCMRAFKLNNKLLPYIKNDTIYQESCKNGVIYNPVRDDSIQDYMSDNGCECAITLEIPGRLKGLNKIYGSYKILDSIIQSFLKYKKEGCL